MKRRKIFAGDRLRRLREAHGISQAELARQLDLSASYLNQIENDHRPLTSASMPRLCDLFGVGPEYFSDEEDLRYVADLREANGDPIFGNKLISHSEAEAVVRASPQVTRRFLQLYRAWRAINEEQALLRARQESEAGGAPAGSPLPDDDARDWVQSHRTCVTNGRSVYRM